MTIQDKTMDAILHPEVGDHFQEMWSFHMFVVHADPSGGPVVTMSAGAPCKFPESGNVRVFDSLVDFVDYYTYEGQSMRHKSWMMLHERGVDVDGWLANAYEAVA